MVSSIFFIWLKGCRFSLLNGLQTVLRTRYALVSRHLLLEITLVIVFCVALEEETETQRLNNLEK